MSDFVGTTTYVNVEIGYASGLPFGGLTIERAPLPEIFFGSVSAAALIPRRPGVAYLPDAFRIDAKRILLAFA